MDVAVIGAGITGLSVAYRLKRAGHRVAVIEANRIAEATTGSPTARITSLHGLIYAELINEAGVQQAQRYADGNQAAIEEIARIVEDESIACDFQRAPAYTFASATEDVNAIHAEVAATQKLGVPTNAVERTELPFATMGAIRMDNQAMFHPRKYCLALAERIAGDGSHVFEGTRATDVTTDDGCEVVTNHGRIRARDVVVATQIPFLDRGGFFARTTPSRSYALAAHIDGPLPEGMYFDTGESGHSIRSYQGAEGSLVIFEGEDHKVGQEEDTRRRYDALEAWARENFPVVDVPYRWSAQDYMPVDGVPYIGKLIPMSDHIYVATGFRKWGMTTGVIASMIIADEIAGKPNPWSPVFDFNRIVITRSAKRSSPRT